MAKKYRVIKKENAVLWTELSDPPISTSNNPKQLETFVNTPNNKFRCHLTFLMLHQMPKDTNRYQQTLSDTPENIP